MKQLHFGSVSVTQRAIFAKHLAVMLKSGIPISESLEIAIESSQGAFRESLTGVLKSVRSGKSLSAAFSNYPSVFPPILVNSVYAGEESGTLVKNLERISLELRKEKELVDKVRGAMLYPAVVLAAAFFLGLWVSYVILPKFIPLFEGFKIKLPAATRALISFSHFMQEYGLVFISALLLSLALTVLLWNKKFSRPLTHWVHLHVPLIGRFARNSNLARFCGTLGTMLESGVNIDEALTITKASLGNFYYQRAIARAVTHIRRGEKLSKSLEKDKFLFPMLVTRMISVGEESGRFEDTLEYLSRFYEEEIDTATKSLTTVLEPILLIIMGALVLFLALAIIVPVFDITSSFRKTGP